MASTNGDGDGGAGGDSSAAVQVHWSSLPDDLLAISYLRLTAPIDRVRFTAVCTAWRAVASPHLPRSVLPWLILDPSGGGSHETDRRVYCPEESVALPPLSLPGEAVRRCFAGSHDEGWVASSEAPFKVVNFFSGAEVALPSKTKFHAKQRRGDPLVLRKVVFSQRPTLSSCIVAAITNAHELALCKVGCPEVGWMIHGILSPGALWVIPGPRGNDHLTDVAFCNGGLYGITRDTKMLIKFEFGGVNEHLELDVNILSLCKLGYQKGPDEHVRYILELRGNLVMVVSKYRSRNCSFMAVEQNSFTVYELVHGGSYGWAKVNNLRDYALFLGPTGSKAVHVPTGGWGDMQRNHIYFSHHRCLRRNDEIPNGGKVFWKSLNEDGYRVYYKQHESVTDRVKGIMSTGYYAMGGLHPPMWLFPHRYVEG